MADNEAKWYVVHTYSGYENKVASNLATTVENRGLKDLIQEIRVPTEKVTEMKDNKAKEVERKIFPGYVIVKMVKLCILANVNFIVITWLMIMLDIYIFHLNVPN